MKWYAILLGAAIGAISGVAVGYFLIPHLFSGNSGAQSLEGAVQSPLPAVAVVATVPVQPA
ncbi:hypothetical protein L0E83_12565 [Marichromatium gracile]|uniref:Uncharacterized protein n=1 Tax=Marichromatium gracile TaxID=1048 RepID=A0A4R4A6W0_MARGR|nr:MULTISPECIES: hypothetical protein [Marichromatium]MBO8084856.1 hypothetical protein [Marichromatium sp.]MBK1709682.1 hypothetical protein [Marichromatium gracile]MCF1184260.1 hypothetical protein [Marichromatium gracile]RNE90985.1 hypothetical protein EBL84_04990 [Marichromatium sp. AB31]RNE93760.1 hypothetical protein EBL85_05010 [Marichromatium sp. AB32]